MKNFSRLKFLFVLFILLLILPLIVHAGQFKVIRVYDGDTVTVLENGKKTRVRLVGIDSPEMSRGKNKPGQPFCQKSQKYLSWLVLNENVKIKSYGLDRYSRILGVVYSNGTNVNFEMVKAGYAEVYRGRSPTGFDVTIFQRIFQTKYCVTV
jgi:micrococcal nuclease